MTTADRRRAGRLMKDARTQALDLLNHPYLTPRQRAMRALVFVEEAARLTPKEYSGAEKQHVVARFRDRYAELGQVGT